jgi:polyhydroxyalkanoate synthesis regulator phasin
MAFIDLFNVPGLWLEISNTFREIRYILAQAKAYKELEPPNTTPLSDSLCAYLHFEKMYRLNLGIFQLVKIQDLVVRLLHEAFSGRLISVDYDDEGWEIALKMKDAKEGLKTLVKTGELTEEDYRAILDALARPSKSPHRDTVVQYRNRLAHRIRPSVDYPQLYTDLQDRAGDIIKDSTGKERGRRYSIGGGSTKPEFLFADLYAALADYMAHVAEMLKALKLIPRLS